MLSLLKENILYRFYMLTATTGFVYQIYDPNLVSSRIIHHINWLKVTCCTLPGHVQIYNSIYENMDSDAVTQVCSIVRSKRKSVTLEIVNVQKQAGTTDCGLFSLAFTTALCYGECPSTKLFSQDSMRKHLEHCFQQSSPFPFPAVERSRCDSVAYKSVRVNVFCHSQCQLPETE